ncbi:uncharacterized protein LOC109832628 isoform X2 [Asparagus officinalis]|uniref:uncharacterized protein LOC109832628 isoform X2 n=1 Tax=Asparagus officinalis TaxID=4686 RepID=UPI00098E8384|nr:uncharacterized protein LOC109832628 isoform X2 [Asparagus officinalis]
MQNRYKILKKQYSLNYKLRNKSGWGWDEEKNMVIAPTAKDWEALIKMNSFEDFASDLSVDDIDALDDEDDLIEALLLNDEDEDEYMWNEMITSIIHHSNMMKQVPRPCRTRPFSGHMLVEDMLSGHPDRSYSCFRMSSEKALGAIDGSHIPVIVKKKKHNRYRNRKNFISQNVMAACSFDHTFLYVAAGWEGSASDMSVLRATLEDGRFYLVDSGYANTSKFIALYRGSRYHLGDFTNGTTRAYRDTKDKYNHRHA